MTPNKLSNKLRFNEKFEDYWDDTKGFRTFESVPYELVKEEYGITKKELEKINENCFISQGQFKFSEKEFDIFVSI